MDKEMLIRDIFAREILDSRGNPTIEAEVLAGENIVGRAAVPSGASTGKYEAVELRDQEERYGGKGVERAVENVNSCLAKAVIGMNVFDQKEIDRALCKADGTENKSNLGANAILGVSMAAARAAAKGLNIPLYRYLGGVQAKKMPVPMMNILNGGVHADNPLDIQEFMIVPVRETSFRERLRICAEIYHMLRAVLKGKGLQTGVGDEGGFAPDLPSNEAAMEVICEAVEKAGYTAGKDIVLAADVAASELLGDDGLYHLSGDHAAKTAEEMISFYEDLVNKYPIISIEDGLAEDDWDGWKMLTERIGDRVLALVSPHLVPASNPLCHVDGVYNGILVDGNMLGRAFFYGAGAGKLPTASAVVADILNAAAPGEPVRLPAWRVAEDGDYAPADERRVRRCFVLSGCAACAEKTKPYFGYETYVVRPGSFAFLSRPMTDKEAAQALRDCTKPLLWTLPVLD